jgi:hypothetical protein
MHYYLVTVTGRDDAYARIVGGYKIDEGQYIFNFRKARKLLRKY